MEIFKKESKYSLEDVFKQHQDDLSEKKSSKMRVDERDHFALKEERKTNFTITKINTGKEVFEDDTTLIIQNSKLGFFGDILIFCLVTPVIIFVVFQGENFFWQVILALLFSVFPLYALLEMLQITQSNFDKRLGLFWKGPYLNSEEGIKKSFRCSCPFNLKDINTVVVKKEKRSSRRSYDIVYIVYLIFANGRELDVFEDSDAKKAESLAGMIRNYLHITVSKEVNDDVLS